MHGTATTRTTTTTAATQQQEAEAENGKKKNCQTVRTIYGSRATSPRKIARKTLQPNVGKFNVTTMCKGWSVKGEEEEEKLGQHVCAACCMNCCCCCCCTHVCTMRWSCPHLPEQTPSPPYVPCPLVPCPPRALLINHAVHLSRYIFVSAAAAVDVAPGTRNENRKVQTVQLNNLQFARAKQQRQLQFCTSHSKWHF